MTARRSRAHATGVPLLAAVLLCAYTTPAVAATCAKAPSARSAQAGQPNGCHPVTIAGTFSGSQVGDGGFSWHGTLRLTQFRDPKSGVCRPPSVEATLQNNCLPWDGSYRGTATFEWARGAPPADCSYTQPTGTATIDVYLSIGSGTGSPVFARQDGWTYDGIAAGFSGPGDLVCRNPDQTSSAGDGILSAFYASGNRVLIATRDMQTFAGTLDYGAGQRWSWALTGDSGTSTRKISKNGLLAIQQEEGLPGCGPKSTTNAACAKAYEDEFGYCTIGYGHLFGKRRCTAAEKKLRWTRAKAAKELEDDLDKRFEPLVRKVGVPLTQCQYDALVSFAYNVSAKSWKQLLPYLTATKLPEVPGRLGGFIGGSDSNKGGKYQVSAALIGRRAREAAVFQHLACSCDGVVPRLGLAKNKKTKHLEVKTTFFDDDAFLPSWVYAAVTRLAKQR